MDGIIRQWDLVRTHEGYFGIVTEPVERLVFLANGVEAELSEEDWNKLEQVPLNIFDPDGSQASFTGLERSTILKSWPQNPFYQEPETEPDEVP